MMLFLSNSRPELVMSRVGCRSARVREPLGRPFAAHCGREEPSCPEVLTHEIPLPPRYQNLAQEIQG